jgi:phage terminase large subunit-like protein
MVLYAGEKSSESPDRMDALVWGVSYLKDDDGGSGGIGRLL